MAGGSQIVINNQGIIITTNGKVVFKAGQHVFEGGQKVKVETLQLPLANSIEGYSHRLDLSSLYGSQDFSKVKYYAFKEGDNASYVSGNLDCWGRTQRLISENADEYKIMVYDPNDSWEIMINEN